MGAGLQVEPKSEELREPCRLQVRGAEELKAFTRGRIDLKELTYCRGKLARADML